jgi:hypothetical protein
VPAAMAPVTAPLSPIGYMQIRYASRR